VEQKVGNRVPGIRETRRDQEVPLTTYAGLQDARQADDAALRKGLRRSLGRSCKKGY